jgi:hypothetical protein
MTSNKNNSLEEISTSGVKHIQKINEDLSDKGFQSIETMLLSSVSPRDIFEIMVYNSNNFKGLYLGNSEIVPSILRYMEIIKSKYNNLTNEGKLYFNKDIQIAKQPVFSDGGMPVIDKKDNILMSPEEVDKTLSILNIAVKIFHAIYEDKEIISNLTTGDKVYLEIKAQELLHLLGITKKQALLNQELLDILKIKPGQKVSSYELLHKILNDFKRDKDLVQQQDDINKKKLSSVQNERISQLLPYHKIRAKSISFIESGPFPKTKLIAKLAPNQKLFSSSKSNVVLMSPTELSNIYKWVYFGGVNKINTIYTEALIVDSAAGQKQKFKDSNPAIIKDVNISSGNNIIRNVFEYNEQYNLFLQALEDFDGAGINFEGLKQYFSYEKDKESSGDGTFMKR